MFVALLAHIAIPLLAGLILVLFVRAKDGFTWSSCNEIAIDQVLISIGATGAIFLNQKLNNKYEGALAIYGILIVLANLILAVLLIYRSYGRERARDVYIMAENPLSIGPPLYRKISASRLKVSWRQGYLDLFLGAMALVLTCLVYWVGYQD